MNTYISWHPIKGRCVHAARDFDKGDHIATNLVIPFCHLDKDWGDLDEYRMAWTNDKDCIALGHINLLNHSKKSNANLTRDIKNNLIRMYAKKKIKKNDELTIQYDCKLWFKPID